MPERAAGQDGRTAGDLYSEGLQDRPHNKKVKQ